MYESRFHSFFKCRLPQTAELVVSQVTTMQHRVAFMDSQAIAAILSCSDGLVNGHAIQVINLEDPGSVFEEMVKIMCDMVRVGLVHCDFNEFNVILRPEDTLIAIDFPQMVSISHANARALFERDLNCIIRFFEKKMGYHVAPDVLPVWDELLQDASRAETIDIDLRASGFNHDDGDARISRCQRQPGLSRRALHESSSEALFDDSNSSVDVSIAQEQSELTFSRNDPCSRGIEALQIQDAGSQGSTAIPDAQKTQPAELSPADIFRRPGCTSGDSVQSSPVSVHAVHNSVHCAVSDCRDVPQKV